MDYEGLYQDLIDMSVKAAINAARVLPSEWGGRDEWALKRLRFARECDDFRHDLFIRGFGY